jgi:hypothetical protein
MDGDLWMSFFELIPLSTSWNIILEWQMNLVHVTSTTFNLSGWLKVMDKPPFCMFIKTHVTIVLSSSFISTPCGANFLVMVLPLSDQLHRFPLTHKKQVIHRNQQNPFNTRWQLLMCKQWECISKCDIVMEGKEICEPCYS